MEDSAARSLAPPPGLIRLRDGRIVPRRSGWLGSGGPLRCAFGHIVSAQWMQKGVTMVVCKVRPESGHAHCDATLYVFTGEMGLFWMDVTGAERDEIKRVGMDPLGVAEFLRL